MIIGTAAFQKNSFQNVLSSHGNEKPAFSYSFGIKSVFEKLCFSAGLVSRTVGLISSDSVDLAKVYDKQSVMLGVGGTSCKWANGDVPLDGVPFSRLDWL